MNVDDLLFGDDAFEKDQLVVESNGTLILCNVFFWYEDKESGNYYVCYNTGTYDWQGNMIIYASRYEPNIYPRIVYSIEDEHVWKIIEKVISIWSSNMDSDHKIELLYNSL